MSEPNEEWDVLTQGYLEGTLTDEQAARLLVLLQETPGLGSSLLNHLSTDAMLTELMRAEKVEKRLASETQKPDHSAVVWRTGQEKRFSFKTVAAVAAMAACVTLALAAAFGFIWKEGAMLSAVTEADEETSNAVAVLTRDVNVQWEGEGTGPQVNEPLSPGWLRIKSGIAQVEFFQGACVLIQGPAELNLISAGEAYCNRGKLSAQVPPQARGFKIGTPNGTIVDLGTEFGLDIGADTAEVHVFKGEVELHREQQMKSLKEGQAAAFAASGTPQEVAANAAGFVTLNDVETRSGELLRKQFDHWQERSVLLNADPQLRMRFDFQDENGSRSLRNRALHGQDVPDGSIVGGAWTEGRWPGKRALDFRNVSDRVRVSVPGRYEALTLTAWVRVNGLDRAFNSLFMSETWSDGRIHWQITRDGRVRLGVAAYRGAPHADYDTDVYFTPERFGQWTHLAVVCDPATKEIRHYINGVLRSQKSVTHPVTLQLGNADLGNWNVPGPQGRVPIRHFSGAMDEFALYGRALREEEIRAEAP